MCSLERLSAARSEGTGAAIPGRERGPRRGSRRRPEGRLSGCYRTEYRHGERAGRGSLNASAHQRCVGCEKKRRRASPSHFLSNQATGRCKPFRIRQLARAALERQCLPRGEPHRGGTPSQRACTGVERSAPRRDRASAAPAPETAHPRTGAGPCDPPMPPGNLPGSGGSATPRYRSRRPCPPEPGPQPARRCRPRAPRTAPSAGSRCRAPDRCRWRSRAASLRTRTRTTRRPGPRASGASRGCSRGRRPTARSRSPACR